MTPTITGQGALRTFPSPSHSPEPTISSYSLPSKLKVEWKSLNSAGIDVRKVTKNGKLQARRVAFSKDNRSIFVTSNRIRSVRGFFKYALPQTRETNARGIDISTIVRIQKGQLTNRFLLARSIETIRADKGEEDNRVLDETSNCVSVIYRVSSAFTTEGAKTREPHRFESLDLVVLNDDDFALLVKALNDLVGINWEERRRKDRDALFLKYHWIDIGKEISDQMSLTEWIILCDKMNIPVKKSALTTIFKDYAIDNDLEEEGLDIADIDLLLKDMRGATLEMADLDDEDDPCIRIWNEIVASDPVPPLKLNHASQADLEMEVDDDEETISAVAFLSFVRSQQKEFSTSLEDVTDLLHVLNNLGGTTKAGASDEQVGEYSPERLSRSRFIAYLTSDSNDLMDARKGVVGSNDMTRPLCEYWINTSHDTYLAKLPNSFSGSSVRDPTVESHVATDIQGYLTALHRGVRALEIDTWDGVYGRPVVARRRPTSVNEAAVDFSEVLRAIGSFLKSNPKSFPVVLCIENHCSLVNQDVMARQINEILSLDNLLYIPPNANAVKDTSPLPSPDSLRGKAVIKSKRPKAIKDGATIINDDFDVHNGGTTDDADTLLDFLDDDEDEDAPGFVIGFDDSGPLRSHAPDSVKLSPKTLLEKALKEAEQAEAEATKAERRAEELKADAFAIEELAANLADEAGLSPSQVRSGARGEAQSQSEGDGSEIDLPLGSFRKELESPEKQMTRSPEKADGSGEEGLEVQDFFEGAVEGARTSYSAADTDALIAVEKASAAMLALNKADDDLREAERVLAESYHREKETSEAARRAAAEARSNREYAETARQRVETVKEMLRTCKDSASSAETVVVTALTEAKISEQRAAETEARASRALATAEKDRAKADFETQKEELLEQEASTLHSECIDATKVAKTARERMEKAAAMLDRVNEQIKLIETSTQFQKEMRQQDNSSNSADDITDGLQPRHVSKFIAKHSAKLAERKECTEVLKAASSENSSAEIKRRQAQAAFEDKAHAWKMQADFASKARKLADRSSNIAEELAEHAEEEREAASLRHIAREKAQMSVKESDSYRTSMQAQLNEAERASAEAASLAVETRQRAEQLEQIAANAKDHSVAFQNVEDRKRDRIEASRNYKLAIVLKEEAEAKASDAKRLLDTSSEVYTSAKRVAAAEVHRVNAERQAERNAIDAYKKALLTRKQATHALSLSQLAARLAADKAAAAKHAWAYKKKTDMIVKISAELATLTLLHSCKHKNWQKSLTLPSTHMHSFSQGKVFQLLKMDATSQANEFVAFTQKHICRTFPPWQGTKNSSHLNNDPVPQWAVGCQLVSMNFHSGDEYLLLNDGRFRENGSSGYVLKPNYLRVKKAPADREQHWKLQVLSGYCLPKPELSAVRKVIPGVASSHVNPCVRVSLYDSDGGTKTIYTTKPAKHNGFNPVWSGEREFDMVVKNPSVAIVLLSVWDEHSDGTGDFMAAAAIPVSCLRAGYRSVALFDSLHTRCGPYAFSSLFVRAQKLSS